MALIKKWTGRKGFWLPMLGAWMMQAEYSNFSYKEAKDDIKNGVLFLTEQEAKDAREFIFKKLRSYQRKLNKTTRVIDKLKQ